MLGEQAGKAVHSLGTCQEAESHERRTEITAIQTLECSTFLALPQSLICRWSCVERDATEQTRVRQNSDTSPHQPNHIEI